MKKTVNDIKYLCNLLQYMSREPGLFSNGYISYISIGRYAKIHLEKWDQKEKSKREKNRFNHAKRQLEQIEKDL